MAADQQTRTVTLIIEGDYADGNFTAYIPEMRLSAVGDTIEEVKANAIDVIRMEKEHLQRNFFIETVQIDLNE